MNEYECGVLIKYFTITTFKRSLHWVWYSLADIHPLHVSHRYIYMYNALRHKALAISTRHVELAYLSNSIWLNLPSTITSKSPLSLSPLDFMSPMPFTVLTLKGKPMKTSL